MNRKPKVLFIVPKWHAYNPTRGPTLLEWTAMGSLEASGLATVNRFYYDECSLEHGTCDAALLKLCTDDVPEIIFIYWMTPHWISVCERDYNPKLETLDFIRTQAHIPIVSMCFDTWAEINAQAMQSLHPWVDFSMIVEEAIMINREKEVMSLPVHFGFDPRIFYNPDLERDIQVSFVGKLIDCPDRIASLYALKKNHIDVFCNNLIGIEMSGPHEYIFQLQNSLLSVEEYARIFMRSKITLNFTTSSRDIKRASGRTYEATLCGALLIESENPETPKWLEPMVEYVPFSDELDLVKKVRYYLEHDEERKIIAERGHQKAKKMATGELFWKSVFQYVLPWFREPPSTHSLSKEEPPQTHHSVNSLIHEAKAIYKQIKDFSLAEELSPTKSWIQRSKYFFTVCATQDSVTELIHFLQEHEFVRTPWFNTHPFFSQTIDAYHHWLNSIETPLSSYDFSIQESPFSNPKLTVSSEGRRVSVNFFWYLCVANRVLNTAKITYNKMIGFCTGYGDLARLFKLLVPEMTFYILDGSESIFFSYIYLRANFPEAKIKVVLNQKEELLTHGTFDFVLVPISYRDALKGIDFDCFINLLSLGEMAQHAVEETMRFIQEEIHVHYFYSINRYGQSPHTESTIRFPNLQSGERNGIRAQIQNTSIVLKAAHDFYEGRGTNDYLDQPATDDICNYSTPLDAYWKVILWKLHSDKTFTTIELSDLPSLELMVERGVKRIMPEHYRKFISDNLLNEAMQKSIKDREWEYLMWESVRFSPSKVNLPMWLEYLQQCHRKEFFYFKELYEEIVAVKPIEKNIM